MIVEPTDHQGLTSEIKTEFAKFLHKYAVG